MSFRGASFLLGTVTSGNVYIFHLVDGGKPADKNKPESGSSVRRLALCGAAGRKGFCDEVTCEKEHEDEWCGDSMYGRCSLLSEPRTILAYEEASVAGGEGPWGRACRVGRPSLEGR